MTKKQLELVRDVLASLEWDDDFDECFTCWGAKAKDKKGQHSARCRWVRAKTLVDRELEKMP